MAATIALAAAIMVGASGCTFAANIATQKPYDPSDGVGTTLGPVSVRNVLLITDEGNNLNLVVTVANNSDEVIDLQVEWNLDRTEGQEFIELDPMSLTELGGPDEQRIVIDGTDVVVGSLVPIFFTYEGAEGSQVQVPVLDGSLPEYELYVPPVTPESD
ncbi:MAG TPA: hypothetical protein VFM95_00905 [Microcella sp.]|nr:hypothetical protein [Microcella sp.]